MAGPDSAELRIGLVLYGGVSLAVYIYGVVLEVQRLLGAAEGEDSAYGRALADAGLSGAVVDVIAGTSAGGINGILLAKAISAGADIGSVRDLWVRGGDIGGLIDDAEGSPEPASLLSTEVFERHLRQGFDRLDRLGSAPDPKQRDAALDLFVSATHLRGDRREFREALGRSIQTLKHRFVFRLKIRDRYRSPLDDFRDEVAPGTPANARLVALARATSAFPVAFEPVELGPEQRLFGADEEPAAWMADGGILNNKPFTEALEAIFTRSSEQRPVRRWLLSIDPDPTATWEGTGPGEQPGFDEVALAGMTKVPRYQSLVADLESLEAHNAAVRRVAKALLDLEVEFALQGAGAAAGAPTNTTYRRLRQQLWAEEIAAQLLAAARPASTNEFDPDETRAALAAGALSQIRAREESLLGGAGPPAETEVARADLAFQRRRVYYLIKLLEMALELRGSEDGADPARLRAVLWGAFERISAVLWEVLASRPFELGADERPFDFAVAALGEGWGAFAEVGAEVEEAVGSALRGVAVVLPAEAESVAVPLEGVFDGFPLRDSFLLPIEAGGGVRYRDLVNHAQVSPEAATATGVPAKRKLAGDAAGHFGGFLERSWRCNDILWGRLDAAETLVRAVLAEATPEQREAATEAAIVEILASDCPDALKRPDGDWRAYLREHAIGEQTPKNLTRSRQLGLGYRAAAVARRMLHRARREAERRPEARRPLRTKALGGADDLVRKWLAPPWFIAGLFMRRHARGTREPDEDR